MTNTNKLLTLGVVAALSMAGGQAYAVDCPTEMLVSAFTHGFSCTEGDKTFSDFFFHADPPGAIVEFEPLTPSLFEVTIARGDAATLEAGGAFAYHVEATAPATIVSGSAGVDAIPAGIFHTMVLVQMGSEALTPFPIVNSGNASVTFNPGLAGFSVVNLFNKSGTGPVISSVSNQFQQAEPVPAPEPASLALFGLGLVGLGFARRRKRS